MNVPLDTITWVTATAMAENGKAANNKRANMFTSLFQQVLSYQKQANTKHFETTAK